MGTNIIPFRGIWAIKYTPWREIWARKYTLVTFSAYLVKPLATIDALNDALEIDTWLFIIISNIPKIQDQNGHCNTHFPKKKCIPEQRSQDLLGLLLLVHKHFLFYCTNTQILPEYHPQTSWCLSLAHLAVNMI